MTRAVVFFLAILLVLAPAGRASAQLEAPEGLFFADIPDEIRKLVDQLYKGPTPAEQVAAAGKLAAMGEGAAPALTYLVPILSENVDASVRQAVVVTISRIGKPAYEPILATLKSPRTDTRISAIEVLTRMGDAQAATPLTDLALRDPSEKVREAALESLSQLARGNPAVAQKLVATVQDEKAKPEIRSRAMKALGRMANIGLPLDSLKTMLSNAEADIRLRCAAAAALGQSGNTAAVASLVEALGDEKAPIRTWAAVALNGNAAPEAVTALTKALEDEDDRVRVRAADALAAIQDTKLIDPLSKVLDDTNTEARVWATIGLGNYSDQKALDALQRALQDSDVEVRVAAADSLGRTHNPKATPVLISVLNDFGEDTEVRSAAARALSALRDSRAVPALISLVRDNDPALRRWAVSALGRIGDARALEPLIGALGDSEPAVRGWAALALARFRDPRIIDPLVKAAEDPEAQVRARVVLALRGINDDRVKAVLQAAAQDPDPLVQEKARQVLGPGQ